MVRRQLHLSPIVILFLTPTTAFGNGPVIDNSVARFKSDLSSPLKLSLGIDYLPTRLEDNLLESVTMQSFPSGSLMIRFDGFHGFVVKHIHSQFRRFMRQAVREGWYVRDASVSKRALFQKLDHGRVDPRANGVWWDRTWIESLPPEKGGAPLEPYVHAYGRDTAWKIGPLTVTNTFSFKFDYFGFFELKPDPVSHEHSSRGLPIALDVRSIRETTVGTRFRVRIRPNLRLGLPRGSDWESVLRGVSIRAPFDIYHYGEQIIKGEVEIKWRPRDGFIVSLEVSLVTW